MTPTARFNNRQLWQLRVNEFMDSGLPQKQWCSENNVKRSTLRYWIRKFRDEVKSETDSSWIPVDVSDPEYHSTPPISDKEQNLPVSAVISARPVKDQKLIVRNGDLSVEFTGSYDDIPEVLKYLKMP